MYRKIEEDYKEETVNILKRMAGELTKASDELQETGELSSRVESVYQLLGLCSTVHHFLNNECQLPPSMSLETKLNLFGNCHSKKHVQDLKKQTEDRMKVFVYFAFDDALKKGKLLIESDKKAEFLKCFVSILKFFFPDRPNFLLSTWAAFGYPSEKCVLDAFKRVKITERIQDVIDKTTSHTNVSCSPLGSPLGTMYPSALSNCAQISAFLHETVEKAFQGTDVFESNLDLSDEKIKDMLIKHLIKTSERQISPESETETEEREAIMQVKFSQKEKKRSSKRLSTNSPQTSRTESSTKRRKLFEENDEDELEESEYSEDKEDEIEEDEKLDEVMDNKQEEHVNEEEDSESIVVQNNTPRDSNTVLGRSSSDPVHLLTCLSRNRQERSTTSYPGSPPKKQEKARKKRRGRKKKQVKVRNDDGIPPKEEIKDLPENPRRRGANTFYMFKGMIRFWDGKKLRCMHKMSWMKNCEICKNNLAC